MPYKVTNQGSTKRFLEWIGGGMFKEVLNIIANIEELIDEEIAMVQAAQEIEERRLHDAEREEASRFRHEVLERLNRIERSRYNEEDPSLLQLELDGLET
jgi:hypothetical protein